jgi:hypothetical protein
MEIKEIRQIKTPEALYSAIEKYLAEPEGLSCESVYREAQNSLIRFRRIYSKLPDRPSPKEDPVVGLQDVMDWCIRADEVINNMVDEMEKSVIEKFICKLNELKELPTSGFPQVNTDILEKAKDRAQRIVDKYQVGKKLSKRLSINTYCLRMTKFSEIEIIISRLVEVARERAKGPDMQVKSVGGQLVSASPLNIEMERALTEMKFARAVEKIYRIMDPNYKSALTKLDENISSVLEKLKELNATDTGDLLGKYDELKGLNLQDRIFRMENRYSIDSIVETALFGPDQDLFYRGETRETLAEGLIKTLRDISRKTKGSITQEVQNMIKLFISHSSKDQELVERLIELVKNALHLSSSEIRCTTIDGYRLPGGAKTNEQLKREVRESPAFIGLISTAATDSMYVLFELGARWGSDRHLLPLLAPGVSAEILKGPLSEINALNCNSSSQLQQLVQDLAEVLNIRPESPAAYQRYIDEVLNISRSEDNIQPIDEKVETVPTYTLTDIQIRIMKAVAGMNRREATVAKVAGAVGISDMEAKYNLDELSRKHKFLSWIGNMDPNVPDCYTLTHEGRGFVLSQKDN